MKPSPRLATALAIVAALLLTVAASAHEPPGGPTHALYDSDPEHLWNKLHRALFMRVSPTGDYFGHDDHELLYWNLTRNLLEGESHARAIALLDSFLETNADSLIDDPLKRALLQHDLWALFDWSANRGRPPDVEDELAVAIQTLQARLVAVMKRIALTDAQINALPNNLERAAQSHPATYNPKTREPFLPADFFDESSGWVRIIGSGGDHGARQHVQHADGRSQFWVFIRLPGSQEATSEYVETLREFPTPYAISAPGGVWVDGGFIFDVSNPSRVRAGREVYETELPQFPPGAAVALLTQMLVLNDHGRIVPTNLTQNVQLRVYRQMDEAWRTNDAQDVFEFRLSRRALLENRSGGLLPLSPGDRRYFTFRSHGIDPFENFRDPPLAPTVRLNVCFTCHARPGIYSFLSRDRILGYPGRRLPQQGLRSDPLPSVDYEWLTAIAWKTNRYSRGLLQGLWRAVPDD